MCIDSKIKVYEHNPLESLMRMDKLNLPRPCMEQSASSVRVLRQTGVMNVLPKDKNLAGSRLRRLVSFTKQFHRVYNVLRVRESLGWSFGFKR